jgi:SAM-dependent methyltransferase
MMKPDQSNYTEFNAKTIDGWVEEGWEWSVPITHEEFIDAQNGHWGVYLTPTKIVPKTWFPPFSGAKLLGLASGGGQQMPVFTALGAQCTVLDYSDKQLDRERLVAEREGYEIHIIKGDMTKRLPLQDECFDLIFHPVSNCYVEDVCHVWNECFRVLKKGGVLLGGMDNGLNFLFNDYDKLVVENKLPFNPLKNPEQMELMIKENSGMQFSHFLEEQLGGQLKAGFILTDLYDDYDRPGDGRLHEFAPTHIATRAVKP